MTLEYDEKKNKWLLRERGISFEDVIIEITENGILADYIHPNQDKYPGQRIMVVNIGDYTHCVPYVLDGETIHLKTVYPSRKFLHLLEEENHESR